MRLTRNFFLKDLNLSKVWISGVLNHKFVVDLDFETISWKMTVLCYFNTSSLSSILNCIDMKFDLIAYPTVNFEIKLTILRLRYFMIAFTDRNHPSVIKNDEDFSYDFSQKICYIGNPSASILHCIYLKFDPLKYL